MPTYGNMLYGNMVIMNTIEIGFLKNESQTMTIIML